MSSMPPTPEAGTSAAGATAKEPVDTQGGEQSPREPDVRRKSPFLPLLLLAFAGVSWPEFQCYQLINEKQALAAFAVNQTPQFEDAGKMRNTFDTVTRETALLAGEGNAGAKLIVDELARRGININRDTAPAGSTGPAK